METFSFLLPKNLSDGVKWVLATISFEATNSFLNKTDEYNSFSITTPRYWFSRGGADTIHKLQNFLELRSHVDIELHVEENRKRGNQIKIGENEYKLSNPDTHKNEIIDELKNLENNDLEDMVFRKELTYSETEKDLM